MSSLTAMTSNAALSAPNVSVFQLYLLRVAYLILAVGLVFYVWPDVIHHGRVPVWQGLTESLLAAIQLLAMLGLRYPIKMLPLLFFEIAWKSIWLAAFALPLLLTHSYIDAAMAEKIQACLLAVIIVPLIPWRYVFMTFASQPGDRWR